MTADVGREVEAVDLSALDWEPECEYSKHGSVGAGSPVEWAIHMRQVRVCGCLGLALNLNCAPCWTYRRTRSRVRCCYCGAISLPYANVLRVERIRPPSSP